MIRWGIGLLCLCLPLGAAAQQRLWTDASSNFSFSGELLGYTADHVILQRVNKELVTVPIAQLSADDRKFLETKEAAEITQRRADQQQTWTLANGLKVVGRVVDFVQNQVTVQKKRQRVYVDDRPLRNLPPVQQRIILRLASHYENQTFEDEAALEKFLDNQPHVYQLDGVVFEHESRDEFGVPFFFFNDQDRAMLEAGWQRWKQAADTMQKEQAEEEAKAAQAAQEYESLKLQHSADSYLQDQQADRDIKMLELSLLATAAGVTDMWEVQIFPNLGVADYPRTVIVPGRNSQDARVAVAQRFPNYSIGAIAKINRGNRGFRW